MNSQARPRKLIGDELIEKGVITPDQLKIALLEQKRSNGRIGETLVKLGFLTESVLNEALGESLGQETVDLKDIVPDPDALRLVEKSFAKKLNVMPIAYLPEENALQVAMSDTFDILTLDRITAALPPGLQVEPVLASESEIESAIDQLYGYELSIDGILNEIETGQLDTRTADIEGAEYSHPTVRLVDAFLTDAVKKEASDIFEPEEGFLPSTAIRRCAWSTPS